jgi:NAD(P)-dependent dehydrogenase (short-subunit alcohol dehydrogenase family)
MSTKWTAQDMPDQDGRIAVVTGANSGLGLETARELARHGAQVVLACRNTDKGEQAAQTIRADVSDAQVDVRALDLGSLDSVRSFAEGLRSEHASLDLLINNAGVMAPPRRTTADGFELQFGTNHLGHFALTGLLMGILEKGADTRVVTLSSGAHRIGKIDFDDLQREHRYSRWRAYGQSKLSNLMFALELDRRLRAAGSSVLSVAAHPGYAATNLQTAAAPLMDRLIMKVGNFVIAQSAAMGALPTLYAATKPDLEGGMFIGPDGMGEQRGYPRPVAPSQAATNEDVAARLWEVSEELTGVRFELPAGAAA